MQIYRNYQTEGGQGKMQNPAINSPSPAQKIYGSNPSQIPKAGHPAEWTPRSSEEAAYYDILFQSADVGKTGVLAGQAAVSFFMKSGLDINILRQIWELADHAQHHYLSRHEFYSAMRLIAMAQYQPNSILTRERMLKEGANPLPLPKFIDAPAPPPTLQISQGFGNMEQKDSFTISQEVTPMMPNISKKPTDSVANRDDPYKISAEEYNKYEMLFPTYDPDGDGFVTGQEAVPLFNKSGLERNILKQIWELADVDRDVKLNKPEFICAMHLIVCISRKSLPLPVTLPPSLYEIMSKPTSSVAVGPITPSSSNEVEPATHKDPSRVHPISTHQNLSLPIPPPPPNHPIPKPMTSTAMSNDDNRTHSPRIQNFSSMGSFLSVEANSPMNALPNMQPQQNFQLNPIRRSNLGSGAEFTPPADTKHTFFKEGDGGHEIKDVGEAADGLIQVAHNCIASKSNMLTSLSSSTSNLSRIVQGLETEKTNLIAELQSLNHEHNEQQNYLDQLIDQLGALQTEVENLRSEKREKEKSLSDVRDKIAATNLEISKTHNELVSKNDEPVKNPSPKPMKRNSDHDAMLKRYVDDPFGLPSPSSFRSLPNGSHVDEHRPLSTPLPTPTIMVQSPKSTAQERSSYARGSSSVKANSEGLLSPYGQNNSNKNGQRNEVFFQNTDPFKEDDPFAGVMTNDFHGFDAFPTPKSADMTRFDAFEDPQIKQ